MIYILKWITISLLTEFVLKKYRLIQFKNGWNLFWSGTIYLAMYTLSYSFIFRKLMVVNLSLFITCLYMFRFRAPMIKTK